MLAESHTVSKDGLTYTFKLRQGIKFHNGKEMTSEDVVPSLARWGKQSIYGKARVAQVETGELEFADDLNLDAYERLKKNPNARTIISKPYYWLVAVFNKKEGLMTNAKLRQAWQAAIDIEPIMKNVAGGHAEFYRMDSSLAPVEIAAWHTKLAGLPWNEHNREKARRRLRPDAPRLSHGELAGLDHRRGHREIAGRARARDRSKEAHGALGDADSAVLREGAGDPLRRPVRAPRDADVDEGLQREDRAHPLLQRVARQVR